MNSNNQQNSQKKTPVNDNWIEQLRDVGRGVGQTVKRDLGSGMVNDALSSLFGTPKNGDLQEGQEINLGKKQEPRRPITPEQFPFMARRKQQERHSQYSQELINRLKQKESEVAKKIEEVRLELKALIAEVRSIDKEVAQAVDSYYEPSQYYISFLERLKTIIKLMRQNLHSSNSWLKVMRSRKKERTYWALYKKKGTEFGLNHERVLAHQTG